MYDWRPISKTGTCNSDTSAVGFEVQRGAYHLNGTKLPHSGFDMMYSDLASSQPILQVTKVLAVKGSRCGVS